MVRNIILIAGLLAISASAAFAESGFLTAYDNLKPQPSQSGTDLLYVSPGGDERLAAYNAVMVDQPEIHFSVDSEYRGLKAVDVEAIATLLYENLVERLKKGGYNVVDQAGADVLYLRTALSELYLKKKKRRLMSYTPVGAIVKAGTDALSDTLDKVDIIEMTLEAELADSQSGEVLDQTTKTAEVEKTLASALSKHAPAEKRSREHVREGRKKGVDWETEVPVTDPGAHGRPPR